MQAWAAFLSGEATGDGRGHPAGGAAGLTEPSAAAVRVGALMLLSFAQFEREITGERIRDKVAASKRKGVWMGGAVPLGYRVEDRALHVVEQEAEFVCSLFRCAIPKTAAW